MVHCLVLVLSFCSARRKAPFSAGVSLHPSPGLLTSLLTSAFVCMVYVAVTFHLWHLLVELFLINLRNRVTDVENNVMVTSVESGGINWETEIDIYTVLYINRY